MLVEWLLVTMLVVRYTNINILPEKFLLLYILLFKFDAKLRTGKLWYESRCRQSLPEIVLIVRIYYVPSFYNSIMEELTISKFNGI